MERGPKPEGAPARPGSPTPIAALEGVVRSFDGGRVSALRGVWFSVDPGAYVAVVGPSGSGKSTLVHLLSGLDRPTGGRVLFRGQAPSAPGAWARLRSREIGIVFQAFHLLPTLTAAENVEVPMFGVVRSPGERRRRALGLLERVGMSHRAGHRPGELSGGERQRTALARALANGPSLLLADEPTGNLDTQTSREIVALLEEVRRDAGTTLVLVTHNREVAAGADRTVTLVDGRVQGGAD